MGTYYLILILIMSDFSQNYAVTIDHIEFNSFDSCAEARSKIKRDHYSSISAYCVKKEKQTLK